MGIALLFPYGVMNLLLWTALDCASRKRELALQTGCARFAHSSGVCVRVCLPSSVLWCCQAPCSQRLLASQAGQAGLPWQLAEVVVASGSVHVLPLCSSATGQDILEFIDFVSLADGAAGCVAQWLAAAALGELCLCVCTLTHVAGSCWVVCPLPF